MLPIAALSASPLEVQAQAKAGEIRIAHINDKTGPLEGVPVASALFTPDRWLGLLFVLSVYHFPTGIVGRLRALGPASTPPTKEMTP
jgi:hypothetical protein